MRWTDGIGSAIVAIMDAIGIGRSAMVDAEAETRDAEAHERLSWLLDAPLFTDEALVDRLFDAVVRPTYEIRSREVGAVSESTRRRLLGGEVSATIKTGLPFLAKGEGALKGRADLERTSRDTTSDKLVVAPVVTAGRKLEEIALVALDEFPERVAFISSTGEARDFAGRTLTLPDLEAEGARSPRMLTFLDVAAGTPIIPMACELASGRTELLYKRYTDRLWHERESPPSYPEDDVATPDARREYWRRLSERFSSRAAMEIVEDASVGPGGVAERMAWIDFRIPVGGEHTLHLHCVPDGREHTGVFGYNLVRRGFRHGIKVVGTLKAGFAINALAVFDR